jgi:hypothetical protein
VSWNIDKRDKFEVYVPSFHLETEFISAISILTFDSNKIIDSTKFHPSHEICKALQIAFSQHEYHFKSFVVIFQNKLIFPSFSESFVFVTTQSEAIDYIYMEELERNL